MHRDVRGALQLLCESRHQLGGWMHLECCAHVPADPASLQQRFGGRWLTAESRGYNFVARIVRDVVARDMVMPGQHQRIIDAARL